MAKSSWNGVLPSDRGIPASLPTSAPAVTVATADVVRLMLETLTSLGFDDAADTLSRQSGLAVDAGLPAVRHAILEGRWADVLTRCSGAEGE
jgi:hypothetical protein